MVLQCYLVIAIALTRRQYFLSAVICKNVRRFRTIFSSFQHFWLIFNDFGRLARFWKILLALGTLSGNLQKCSPISYDFQQFSAFLIDFQRFWATCAILNNFARSWDTLRHSCARHSEAGTPGSAPSSNQNGRPEQQYNYIPDPWGKVSRGLALLSLNLAAKIRPSWL